MNSSVQTFTWHHLPPTVVVFKRAVASVKELTCRNTETHRETGEKDKMKKATRKQSNSGNKAQTKGGKKNQIDPEAQEPLCFEECVLDTLAT